MPVQCVMPPIPSSPAAVRVLDVSEEGQKLLVLLFPQLAGLKVYRIEDTGDAVVISASCVPSPECCPACGSPSARVHGGYSRTVADGAAGGRPVLIILRVLRFLCLDPSCPKATFAMQADGLTSRYCRRSVPLTGMLTGFGLELAGRAGARLAARLGIAVHSSTILRLIAALPEREAATAPEILGIDDFALRKGHMYGTVLVNMDTGDVVDMLPDREAGTVEAWLKAHPGAAVICRDRAGAYAEAASAGAPDAIQVADRWHMWHNLAEYANKAVTRHRGCLLTAGHRAEAGEEGAGTGREPAGTVPPDAFQDEGGRERPLAARTRARYADIRARLDAGHSQAEISRATGLARPTVRRLARAGSAEELLGGTARGSRLDEFKPYLCRRWNEGARDGAALHAELQARGWTGSARTVRRYLAQFREPGTAPPGTARGTEGPADHPPAADQAGPPGTGRAGAARRDTRRMPAHRRPRRPHHRVRRDDGRTHRRRAPRPLARRRRGSRRPARAPLLRHRNPHRQGSRPQRAHPPLQLGQGRGHR